jgi:PAS domain S-box-containing protein
MAFQNTQFSRYAFAIAVAGVGIVVRQLLEPVLDAKAPFTFAYAIVALVVWLWGAGPSIVAAFILWGGGAFLWLRPFDVGDVLTIGSAGVVLALLVALTSKLRSSIVALAEDERKLRESDERYHLVNQATNDIIWDWNIATNHLSWNESVEQFLGRKRAEMPPTVESWRQHIHPEDREGIVAGIRRSIDSGESSWTAEYRFGPPGGPYRTVLDRGLIARDDTGRAYRMIGSMLDLTESQRAEEALRQNELFARKVLASSLSGLYIYDLLRREMTYISPQYTRLTGYTLQDLAAFKGDALLELFHPDDHARVAGHVASAARASDDEVREIEYRFRAADGRWIWCLSRETVFARDLDGSVRQYIGTFLDITARRGAEEALRASEEKFRSFFEQASIGMGRVSFEDALWIDVNDAFCRMLGYDREEMLRTPWPDITYPDDVDLDLVPFRRMAAGELESYAVEKRFVHKQGHQVWARLTLSLVRDHQGRPDHEIAVIEDITYRKEAEQQVLESRRKLEAALSSMTDAVVISDAEGRFIDFNDAFAAFHRFDSKEECAKTLAEHPDIVDVFLPDGAVAPVAMWPVPRALRGETATNAEYTLRRKDTGETWVGSYSFAPIRDKDGAIVGSVVAGRDITEGRRTEEELRRAHGLIHGITQGTEDLIAAEDGQFRYIFFNDAYRREFRRLWDQELEVGTSMVEALAKWPEEQRKAVGLWRRALDGESFSITTEFGPSEDDKQVYDLRYNPVYDAEGRPIGAAHILRNVTGRVRTQEALSQSERLHRELAEALEAEKRKLQTVIDELPVGVAIGNPDGTTLSLNRVGFELHGFRSHEEMLGTVEQYAQAFELRHLDGRVMPVEDWPVSRALRGDFVRDCEVRICNTISSEERIVSYSAVPVQNNRGDTVLIVYVIQDLTERKRAEEALREADRRKDEFLAILGHELRNPLAPISNAAQILQKVDSTQPVVLRAREIIERQVSHMVRLIDDLLDVSRISRGKVQLKRETLDVSAVVGASARDYQQAIETSGLRLELALPAKPVWVFGDEARIHQIVDNLLSNAVKFTDSGGRVRVSVGTKDDHALIAVRDTGIGVDEETLGRLFEPFSQAERSLSRSRGGLGLGLALVKGLTELHGGSVAADSPGPGGGFRVEIRLPLEKPLTMPAEDSIANRERRRTRRILVIEDNVDAAESMEMLLSLLGHQVAVAHSGLEGIEKAGEFRPDVVICDIGLPGEMDGYAVARAIRNDRLLSSVHLIAMTGYGQDDDRRRAQEAGFDHHLTKPAGPEVLEPLLG